jgi:hypothetical protein
MSIAGRVGVISALLLVSIGSISGSPDGGSSDADRHAATHVSSTISGAAIGASTIRDAAVITGATNTGATAAAICKGVGRNHGQAADADDDGCENGDNSSTRHD